MAVPLQAVSFCGLSETYEDTFGEYESTITNFTGFAYEGDPIERKAVTVASTAGMATGALGVTQTEVVTVGFDASRKFILTPDLAGICLTSLGASESSGTANINYLTFLSSPSSVTLKSRNLLEKYGDASATHGASGTANIVQYSGVQPTSFMVEADKSGYVKATVQMKGYAAYKNSSLTVAGLNDNRVSKTQFLRFGDATFKTGTNTFVTTGLPQFSSTADWKAKLQSFSWSVVAKIVEGGMYQFGTTATGTLDGTVKEYPFAGYEATLKARFMSQSVEDATDFWKTREMAQTEFAVQIPIVGQLAAGSDYYSVIALFPRVRVKSANLVTDNGVLMHDVDFEVIFRGNSAADAADTAIAETFLYVTVKNNDSPTSYIAGAS